MPNKLPQIYSKCQQCDTIIITNASKLARGRSKYCSHACRARAEFFKHGYAITPNCPTYNTWASMKQRCTNPNNPKYYLYGARGISICEKWQDFSGFIDDMGERPNRMTIDRIDNNGNYEPSNCRWATIKTQQRNLRNNITITYNGDVLKLQDIADKYSIKASVLNYRLLAGWDIENALNVPVKHGNWKLKHSKQLLA